MQLNTQQHLGSPQVVRPTRGPHLVTEEGALTARNPAPAAPALHPATVEQPTVEQPPGEAQQADRGPTRVDVFWWGHRP
eukprot:2135399-Prorocentrum_lima.AAC.1